MLTLPRLVLFSLVSLLLWAWMAIGAADGYFLAVRTLHLHSPWLIAFFIVAFAFLALFILSLLLIGWLRCPPRRLAHQA